MPTKNEGAPGAHHEKREGWLSEARTIVRVPYPGYEELHSKLSSGNLLTRAADRAMLEYHTQLRDAEFMTPKDREMLAVLWLYDEETASHSVASYRLAKEKLDRPLLGGRVRLADAFTGNSVLREQFLRASLFHDIGKLAIPLEVLGDHTDDHACAQLLLAHPEETPKLFAEHGLTNPLAEGKRFTANSLMRWLHEQGRRPQHIVPLRLMLERTKHTSSLEDINADLKRFGLSIDNTLIEIMDIHDRYSRSILRGTGPGPGMPVEAELAGAHHTHARAAKFPLLIQELGSTIDPSDIIHLADVTEAMSSRRRYKTAKEPLEVLDTLVGHATHDLIGKEITYLWVEDELQRLGYQRPLTAPAGANQNNDETEHLSHIEKFLAQTEREVPRLKAA